jgi:hypothetical protein
VQDAVKLLELNGWTVIAPTKEESNDGATHASVPHDADARR